MVIYKIRKRNGSIVTFEKDKIYNAVKLAFEATGKEDISAVERLTELVVAEVEKKV
jgi:anaerobic ribonucleoside-triphosphate reductase